MNGAHDLGGMMGFGPIDPEADEPAFHAPWEGRVLAMEIATRNAGVPWNLDMIRSVREVADYAAAKRKSLLLENNVISPVYLAKAPANPLLMTDAREIVRFMKEVDKPNVGFLIDTGHTKVSGTALGYDPHAFMDAVAPYVRALHLSDNDGREDQNLPFDETAWFYPRLREFRHVPWVLEAYRLEDGTMKQQVAMLAACKAA